MLSGSSIQYVKQQSSPANSDLELDSWNCPAAETSRGNYDSEHEPVQRVDKGKGRAVVQGIFKLADRLSSRIKENVDLREDDYKDDYQDNDEVDEMIRESSRSPYSAAHRLENGGWGNGSPVHSDLESDTETDGLPRADRPSRVKGKQILYSVESGDQNAVWLLKSILPGSRFNGLRRRITNFPIYGHWAVVICGEVYELNRVGSYAKALLRGRGADAQLVRCSLRDYVNNRGEQTLHCERIGMVVGWRPDDIKYVST